MMRRETDGSGAWLIFLLAALVVVVGVIGYLVSRHDLFGGPRPGVTPRMLSVQGPDLPLLPRTMPVGHSR